MVLATEAREGPNTQDGTEHLTAVSRPLFEGMTSTFHPTLYSGEVARLCLAMCWRFSNTNDVAGEIKDCIVICRSFSFVFSGFAGLYPGWSHLLVSFGILEGFAAEI